MPKNKKKIKKTDEDLKLNLADIQIIVLCSTQTFINILTLLWVFCRAIDEELHLISSFCKN